MTESVALWGWESVGVQGLPAASTPHRASPVLGKLRSGDELGLQSYAKSLIFDHLPRSPSAFPVAFLMPLTVTLGPH